MDHTLDELDACIFDYLAANEDYPKSIDEIWIDITSDDGHRCSELGNANKNFFVSTCYDMDINYNNIQKYFVNGRLYLVYSKKEHLNNFGEKNMSINSFNRLNKLKNLSRVNRINMTNEMDVIDGINNIDRINEMDNIYNIDHENIPFESRLDNLLKNRIDNPIFSKDYLTEYFINNYRKIRQNEVYDNNFMNFVYFLVESNDISNIKKITEYYKIKVDIPNHNGENMIDIAVRNNDAQLLKYLLEYKNKEEMASIIYKNEELKIMNKTFLDEKNRIEYEMGKLIIKLQNKSYWFAIVNIFYLIVIYSLFMFF